MKILLLCKYSRLGASSRLRTLQYLPYLEGKGLEVTVSSLFDDRYLNGLYNQRRRVVRIVVSLYLKRLVTLFGAFRYDLIWVEKEIFPYLPSFAERLLCLLGMRYVADYDDAIFHNYDLSGNPVIRKVLGKKIDVVMRNSACVIAGNAYLASRAKAAGARSVELVPTVVDHTRYTPRRDSTTTCPVVGWIGSPSTQKYVVGIREALVKVCQAHGARLVLVGASPQVVSEFPGVDVEVVPWSEGSEAELISRMDIGIMPLPDGPWEKGKCGYKLIQYMACAVPVIASPVGVNVDIVTGSYSGLLAGSLAEWENALSHLLASPKQRRVMGVAGRKAVENNYSLQVQAPILSRIFNDIIGQSRG
ncbi:Glycosyltransferase involved in cell wall bisynthesis [Pseudomonas benzenivorans]|nr:Glycosyltransferase involved in cell wall bisynthesis [Pseudomonas benzenivorans]